MKLVLVNYADHRMTRSQLLCSKSAMQHGVDVVWPNNPDTLGKEFVRFNADVFRHERGAGYWIWKPYLIYKSMLDMEDGDILIYADSGVEFVNNVSHIIDRMDQDIFFFTNGFPHVEWCKGDVLKHVLQWDMEIDFGSNSAMGQRSFLDVIRSHKQIQASVIFFRVNQSTLDFLKEWLLYCQMPGFIDDSPSKLPNYPTFAEHRHDQAILTCLQIKYGYRLHWWGTEYSMHLERSAEDSYPVMFRHHRLRNSEYA